MELGVLDYTFDFVYGAIRFPCALFKPEVYLGASINNFYQRLFYGYLLDSGFKRTFWQLVFPGQIAGVIKKIAPNNYGLNEYHVRFYNDGVIDCELEFDRFSALHWSGKRVHNVSFLEDILDESSIASEFKPHIRPLFGVKNYSDLCIRK